MLNVAVAADADIRQADRPIQVVRVAVHPIRVVRADRPIQALHRVAAVILHRVAAAPTAHLRRTPAHRPTGVRIAAHQPTPQHIAVHPQTELCAEPTEEHTQQPHRAAIVALRHRLLATHALQLPQTDNLVRSALRAPALKIPAHLLVHADLPIPVMPELVGLAAQCLRPHVLYAQPPTSTTRITMA